MKPLFHRANDWPPLNARRVFMNPHYYIMKNKKILRLESDMDFNSLNEEVKEKVLDLDNLLVLDQNQANWRVVIFRDEIMELDEYTSWLSTSAEEEIEEYDLTAN